MRKLFTAVLAAGIGLGPVAMPAASAEEDPAARLGRFTTPFREDGAVYDPAANTMTGPQRGDNGCLPADENGYRDCLPAGASQNVLADGRVLYWNAIEGTDDLDTPNEAIVPHGGNLLRNDQSRVLSIDWKGSQHTWMTPENSTGYFEGTPTEPPLIPDTDNSNSNEHINSDGSLFCSDQKQLADGTILAAGGTNYYLEPYIEPAGIGATELEGIRNTRIFDPATNNWRKTGDMNYGRWYPSLVTLSDGDVFVASGVTKLMKPMYPSHMKDSGDNVTNTETYDVATGTWADNGEAAKRSLPLFPRLHLLPNGHVYYDAAGQSYNPQGQSYKEALWNIAATYDPAAKAWTDLGVPGLGMGDPADITPVNDRQQYAEPGFRGSTFSQALPLIPNDEGGYDKASYLTAGGVTLMSPGSWKATDTTRINTVEVDGDDAELTSLPAGKLNRPRWYSSAVTLPTGQVFAFSGADVDEVVSPGSESPIRQVEVFTPEQDADGNYVGGKWEDVAVANRKRTYHNNAVLLPDGRVLVGGHAPIPNGYYQPSNNPDLPVREASNNSKDASFEIYEPPYMHWGVSRPAIGNLNPQINYGQNLIVPTADPDSIESVVLVRNPSETHLIDGDQRVVVLPITDKTGDALHVDVTENAAALPPGPYMLFLNKGSDKGLVPSVAKQVFVGASVPGWARGAETYPQDDEAGAGEGTGGEGGTDAAPGLELGASPAASTAVTGTEAGKALATTVVSNDRAADSGRRNVLAALATAVLVFAMLSLAGTRRREAAVRIKK